MRRVALKRVGVVGRNLNPPGHPLVIDSGRSMRTTTGCTIRPVLLQPEGVVGESLMHGESVMHERGRSEGGRVVG
jgi:hypothetical protein